MAAFLIFTLTLKDDAWLAEYRAAAPALVTKFGGEYVARSTEVEGVEGAGPPPSTAAVLRFPSVARIREFLDSEEYRPYREMRLAGSESVLLAFEA